jgi:hypothetical protein
MKHKHYDCIIAWANGAIIEVLNAEMEEWEFIDQPSWFEDNEYRIKPEVIGMNRDVMIRALTVIKDSVINTDFPLTNKLGDAIYAIDCELSKTQLQ